MMRSAAIRALIRVLALTALVGGSVAGFQSAAVARECTSPSSPIETDRPDVTNSSIVVPVGSLQNENGIDLQRKDAAQALSGTNSRWRLGIAPCLEVLVDLPNYFTTLHGGVSGFSDVAPAVKWQLNLPQSRFDVSYYSRSRIAHWSKRRVGSRRAAVSANSLVARP